MEYDTPSRFIRDIDPSLLYVADNKSSGVSNDAYGSSRLSQFKPTTRVSELPTTRVSLLSKVNTSKASSPVADNVSPTLRPGMTIEHLRFGIGTVIKTEGSGENEKATVEFRNIGTKQLLLKFAKYRIV
jgi:DNA helicase-2/ATP-dependent DNA helicase PcrA